ncbi:hypothetical protein IT417_00835 [bacterium]|nr:hypothetical protein [bacterium]
MFKKYWFKALAANQVKVDRVISLEEPEQFESSFPSLRHAYLKSNDIEHTFSSIPLEGDFDAIALLIPSHLKCQLVKKVLDTRAFDNKKVFIEKPYYIDEADLQVYKNLIESYGNRLYFSSKYAFSRADIFISSLVKEEGLPHKFIIRMFEGHKYYGSVMEQLKIFKRHLYLQEGPELDLGFHMINIVLKFISALPDVELKSCAIESCSDLSTKFKFFNQGFGFGAKLTIHLDKNRAIPVELEVGKASCDDERYIIADYGTHQVKQLYTTSNASDPVERIKNGKSQVIATHAPDYLYYSNELLPQNFGKQSKNEQFLQLHTNKICLDLKETRLRTGS